MPTILFLVPDLMFSTRIEDAAKHLGYPIHSLNAIDDADAVFARWSPALLVVSLDAANWERAVQAARRAGARGVALSGAGPSIIAFTDRNADKIADAMMRLARRAHLPGSTKIVAISNRGARVSSIR